MEPNNNKEGGKEHTLEALLAIETSGDVCSFAILRGDHVQAERVFRHEMHLSENLAATLEGLCADAYVALEAITAFAVGIGPGSFTGTRIGVMTAKVFAEVFHRPLFGINALEALAAEYLGFQNTNVVVILPCRANIVYAAVYDVSGSIPKALVEPATFSLADLESQLKCFADKPLLACGTAAVEALQLWPSSSRQLLSYAALAPECPRASTIGRLAWRRKEQGEQGDNPITLVPAYIAPPPISTPKRR